MTAEIHCHDNDRHAARYGAPIWQLRASGDSPYYDGLRHCSYCGSLDPLELLTVDHERLHLADMKYGWPHKFYVDVPNLKEGDLVRVGGLNTGQRPVVVDDNVVSTYDAERAGHDPAEQATDEQLFADGWEIQTTITSVMVRDAVGEHERRHHEQVTYIRPEYMLGTPTSMAKLYSVHLTDLAPGHDFDRVAALLLASAGVLFSHDDDGRLMWQMVIGVGS